MATDLMINTEDRPGELAAIGEVLGNAGVNIEGVSGFGFEGRGMIHICVLDAAVARNVLEAAGIKIEGEADAILTGPMPGSDKPGMLGRMARAVADAGINVRTLYLGTESRGVIVTDDNEAAMRILQQS
jgi:hypothetical protein